MRIGINASFLRKPGTGIGQVTLHFLKALAASPEGKSHTFLLYLEADADIHYLPHNFEKHIVRPWYRRDDLIRKYLWERFVVPNHAKKEGCEAFLSLYQAPSLFSKSLPHLMLVHDIIPELFPEYQGNMRRRFFWRRIKEGIRSATRLVVVSRCTRHDMVKFLGIPEGKIRVAYPGLSPQFAAILSSEAKEDVLEKYHLKPDYLYHGGGLEVRKNTELVLKAYACLKKIMPLNELPPLVISGTVYAESNPLATPVRSLIEKLKLSAEVRLLGHVTDADLPALYQSSQIFIYPSRYEGFGLPVLEAMASGVPVVTSRVSSLPEVGGEAVLYANPDDVTGLAQMLKKLIRDPEFRRIQGEAGRIASERFSWKDFSATIMENLRSL